MMAASAPGAPPPHPDGASANGPPPPRFVPFVIAGSSDEYAKRTCAEEQLNWMKCFNQKGKLRCNEEWELFNHCHGKAKEEYHAVRSGLALAESRSSAQIDLMVEDARREASPAYYSFDYWHAVFPSPLIPNWRAMYARWVALHGNVRPPGA